MRGMAKVPLAGVLAFALAGCGGGEKQDADEPTGTFGVEVVDASFPARQRLSRPVAMEIEVRNTGKEAVPNVAVTLEQEGQGSSTGAFSVRNEKQGLATVNRPVWVLDQGPRSGETAYVNTWALGRLAPGASTKFRWVVTPVRAGDRTIEYTVHAGLDGKAKAEAPGGGKPTGTFQANVSDAPSQARVAPDGSIVGVDQ